MDALMSDLRGDPRATSITRTWRCCARGSRDISTFVLAQPARGRDLGYRYPAQFEDHVFEGADGERIAATIALQEAARPGLIVVHGLFTSSRFDYVRQIAVRAFYEWGFNVAALDLRSFGLTELTSAGAIDRRLEGGPRHHRPRPLHEGARLDQRRRARDLAGRQSSVLDACDPEGAEQALDGGMLAVSPPADPKAPGERLSVPLPRTHPRYPIHLAF